MALQLSSYLLPLLGSAVATLLTAGIGVYYREYTGARSLSVLMLAVTWWSVTYMIGLGTTDLTLKFLAYKLMYPAIGIIPVAWVVFAIQYTGRVRLPTRREFGGLLIIPALTVLLMWTNEYHGLIWSSSDLVSYEGLVVLANTKGPGFWVFTAYMYVLIAFGTGLILQTALLSDGVYRDQTVALSLAVLLPWAGNILYLIGVSGAFDPTNLGFALSGIILMGGIFRRQLLQLVPVAQEIARNEVIDSMAEAVIVVDDHGQVVDFNPAAKTFFEHSSMDVNGQSLDDFLPAVAGICDSASVGSPERTEISLSVDGAERTFDTRVRPLQRGHGTITGHLITLNDMTERKVREQRIEQQRQRLEVVNRVLRHDVRNDMNVVLGHAEMLIDTQQTETHARQIIRKGEDIVELSEKARKLEDIAGENTTEKSVIDVADLVEQTVADLKQIYPDAEFQLERPNRADAYVCDIINSAIRNVVKNAIEHNDKSIPQVEVTVNRNASETEDITIEVADNGPGLPDREQEVIETGTETALKHSTGMGLWLAYWIVTQSGGRITFSENRPRGSLIKIRLPSAEEGTDPVC